MFAKAGCRLFPVPGRERFFVSGTRLSAPMPQSASPAARRREGWAMLFALLFPTVVTIVYFVLLAGSPPAWQQGAYGVGKFVQFGFPVFWVALVQRRAIWGRLPRGREWLEGGALGVAILGAMFLLYFLWLREGVLPAEAVRAVRDKVTGIGVASVPRFVALGAFYALGHSLLEEYYWRWFVFGQLSERFRLATAALISAVGFMAHHVCVLAVYFGWRTPAGFFLTAFFSLSVAVGGVLWAFLYRRHGSLYGVWLSHLLVDAGIFVVGYDLLWRLGSVP
jgi:membrane protease YdiL (CAAX protease family)